MSDKTTFDAQVAALLTSNGAGNISASVHRNLLLNYLSGKIAWLDSLVAAGLSFDYDRIADGSTSPSGAEFSLNASRTKLYFNEFDGVDDLTSLLTLMENGIINIYNKTTPTEKAIFQVNSQTSASSVFTLSGKMLYDTLGTDTDTYVFTFDINTQTSSTTTELSGTQLVFNADISGQSTPQDYGLFSFEADGVLDSDYLSIAFNNVAQENMFKKALLNIEEEYNEIYAILRPIQSQSSFIFWKISTSYTEPSSLIVKIVGDGSGTIVSSDLEADYTIYSSYKVEIAGFGKKHNLTGSQVRVSGSTVSDTTPANGLFSLDNADPSLATNLYIYIPTISNPVWSFLNSSNSVVILRSLKSPSRYMNLYPSNTITESANVYTIPIDGGGDTSIADYTTYTDEYVVEFINK